LVERCIRGNITKVDGEAFNEIAEIHAGDLRRARALVACTRDAAPRGGSLQFSVVTPGRYRISITSRHWIGVIAQGKAGAPLVLQLSGSADQVVGLAITPAAG